MLSRGLGKTTVTRNARIGVYWEQYGLATSDTASIELTIVSVDPAPSALGRMWNWIARNQRTAVTLRWTDRTVNEMMLEPARAVDLSLDTLAPGQYEVQVVVSVSGQSKSRTSRMFTVAPDP